MEVAQDLRPRRAAQLVQQQVEDELAIYDPVVGMVHFLNPTAAIIWHLCDGTRSARDLAGELVTLFGVKPTVARRDVSEALSWLNQKRLLVDSEGRRR